jgi:hypothetical protein
LTEREADDVVILCEAFIEALKSEKRAQRDCKPLNHRPKGRPGMTMTEKIFAMHDISRKGFVRPGNVIQVDVDWIMASELSWGVSSK